VDPPYTVEWRSRNVVDVTCEFGGNRQEFWFLLTSDEHLDNKHADLKLYKSGLKEAAVRGAGLISNGDQFCAMQGKWDPRSDQSQLRAEHRGSNYLDLLVDWHADILEPYAKYIIALGHGNHETSQIDRHGVDLTQNLVAELRARARNNKESFTGRCHGVSGWVRFKTRRGRRSKSIVLYRHHGAGGAARITKGVLEHSRAGVDCPDAHIIIMGHNHNKYQVSIPRIRLSEGSKPYHDEQLHIRIPGAKNAWGDGYGGWEVVKNMGPRAMGAAWLRIYNKNDETKYLVVTEPW
jgi:hypothetical protein